MNQQFITSNGRIINERNILFIKTQKLRLGETFVGKLLWVLVPVFAIILSILSAQQVKDYFSPLIIVLLFFDNFKLLYQLLFTRSFASRIPLKDIRSFELREDLTGLEIQVHLKLRSGRVRVIFFRTLEKQYEPFLVLVSQFTIQPQLA
jgi:hypothetical protein